VAVAARLIWPFTVAIVGEVLHRTVKPVTPVGSDQLAVIRSVVAAAAVAETKVIIGGVARATTVMAVDAVENAAPPLLIAATR